MEENRIEVKEKITVSYFWQCFAMFLLGIIVGFVFSPVKNGVSIGNNNHIMGDNDDDDDICGIDCDDSSEEI
ncbi:MAG: hypothetical protein IKR76_04410 [Ruminococcus sp.]|nr:hypothetical protein [Ruminococcus sp.]